MDLRTTFNDAAQRYDATRRELIPCFDDFYAIGLRLVDGDHEDPIEVIDLGAGTGLMSQFVLASFPNARLTLADVAEDMLDVARIRFAAFGDQIRFVVQDYAQSIPNGPFDLAGIGAVDPSPHGPRQAGAVRSRQGCLVHWRNVHQRRPGR